MFIEDIFNDDLTLIDRELNSVNTDIRPDYSSIDEIYQRLKTEDIAQTVRRFNQQLARDVYEEYITIEEIDLDIDANIDLHLDDIVDIIDKIDTGKIIDYTQVFSNIQQGIENVAENQTSFATMYSELITDDTNRIEASQNNIATSFTDSISSAIEHFTDDLSDFSDVIADGISDSIDFIGETITDLVDSFKSGIDKTIETVSETTQVIGDWLEKLLEDLISLLREIFLIDPEKIKEYMQTFYDIFQSFIKGLS